MKNLLPADMVCVNRRRIARCTHQSVHLSFDLHLKSVCVCGGVDRVTEVNLQNH